MEVEWTETGVSCPIQAIGDGDLNLQLERRAKLRESERGRVAKPYPTRGRSLA
jgi:hypothetical protein